MKQTIKAEENYYPDKMPLYVSQRELLFVFKLRAEYIKIQDRFCYVLKLIPLWNLTLTILYVMDSFYSVTISIFKK